MKKCFKCGVEKPLSEYYKHQQMGDGHLGKCKDCTRKDVKERESYLRENNEDFVINERIRGRDKYYRLNYNSKEKPRNGANTKYRERYPEKSAAKNASQRIPVAKGYNKHHWSYNEPHYRDVIILSIPDHGKIHRYLTYDVNEKMYRTMEGTLLDTRQKHEEYLNLVIKLF